MSGYSRSTIDLEDVGVAEVRSIHFIPGAYMILAIDRAGRVYVWDIRSSILLHGYDIHLRGTVAAMTSPDGAFLFNIRGADEEKKELSKITDRYNSQLSPYYAASRLWVDGVIDPVETRSIISHGIEMANNAPITEKFNVGVIQT